MTDCNGCTLAGDHSCGHYAHGDYIRQGEWMRCPCKDCLVKVMCRNMCDALREFKVISCKYWNMPKTCHVSRKVEQAILKKANML